VAVGPSFAAVAHCFDCILLGQSHPYADAQPLKDCLCYAVRAACEADATISTPGWLPYRNLALWAAASALSMGPVTAIGYVRLSGRTSSEFGRASLLHCLRSAAAFVMLWNKPRQ